MVNVQSKNQARKLVREAQTRANEERAQRERDNVDDLATFLVARTRFAGVEEWHAERVTEIGLEADRRRDEHRAEGAVALGRLRARGESIATLLESGVGVSATMRRRLGELDRAIEVHREVEKVCQDRPRRSRCRTC